MNLDLKKRLKKNAFIFVAATIVLLWNIGSYYLVAHEGVDLFNPSSNNVPIGDESPMVNFDGIIPPPLGNQTNLPNASTLFTLMVFNAPIEITIVFLAEILMGSILGSDEKDRLNFLRLLLLLGASLMLTAANSVVHYLMIWPALHDAPIHAGHTFNDTSTLEEIPQYGGAQTFFSQGVGIVMFLLAALIIVGMHFPVFKYLLKYDYIVSFASLGLPAIYYLIIWISLSKQITENLFYEKIGSQFTLGLIIATAFVVGVIVILLWNLTLRTGPKKDAELASESQYEKVN